MTGMPQGSYRVVDLAEQSGLSPATVDRVLHRRAGVSARAIRQVEQAVLDLDRQQTQLRLGARTLVVDLVMQSPERFSNAVRRALEHELPGLRPATVRARFDLRESGHPADLAQALDRVGRRGRSCQGVLLKAPDSPEIDAAVARLAERGIPVVTLVTDLPRSRRVAYVGLDNRAAGATAAYLVGQWVGDRAGLVLVTMSRASFAGEQERRAGFEEALLTDQPGRELVVLSEADGLDAPMTGLVADLLGHRRDIVAVYSIGGGNRGVLVELDRAGVRPVAYLGHDLDTDNVDLLLSGRISVVLHHDLRRDLRAACRQVLRHHRLLPGAPTSVLGPVQVVTRHNLPARLPAGEG